MTASHEAKQAGDTRLHQGRSTCEKSADGYSEDLGPQTHEANAIIDVYINYFRSLVSAGLVPERF